MKTIDFFDLAYILGGDETIPAKECTEMQNQANEDGGDWTPEDWDNWATEYEDKGCTHGEVYN